MDVENQEDRERGDNPAKTGEIRDEKGRFVPGVSGNPNGRTPGSGGGLKDYDRKKFIAMSDEQKEEFLKLVSPELRYRMAEGNPQNDITTGGDKLPTPILNELHSHHSSKENTEAQEKA